jgi:hypothetical protein
VNPEVAGSPAWPAAWQHVGRGEGIRLASALNTRFPELAVHVGRRVQATLLTLADRDSM